MAFWMARAQVEDFNTWKSETFDADPGDRAQSAKSARVFRSIDNPNEIVVMVEFGSADEARSFRERLQRSGALDTVRLAVDPIITEQVEAVEY